MQGGSVVVMQPSAKLLCTLVIITGTKLMETVEALTGEVDGVCHGGDSAEAEHCMKCQHVFHTVFTHYHHYIVLLNSMSGQSTRHPPDGVTRLWKCV